MNKVLYLFLLFSSSILFGQKNTSIKFAICNDVVGTTEMFDVYKKDTESVVFFNTTKLPQHLKKFDYLAEQGLTEIKLKKNFGTPDILSLAVLNEQYHLAKDAPVTIEGYILNNTATNIYSEMIKKIDIKEDNGKKYLYITTSNN